MSARPAGRRPASLIAAAAGRSSVDSAAWWDHHRSAQKSDCSLVSAAAANSRRLSWGDGFSLGMALRDSCALRRGLLYNGTRYISRHTIQMTLIDFACSIHVTSTACGSHPCIMRITPIRHFSACLYTLLRTAGGLHSIGLFSCRKGLFHSRHRRPPPRLIMPALSWAV
jgi:hypothetical protein